MIGRDNPNVNKSLEKLIDTELKQVGGELLKGALPLRKIDFRKKNVFLW
jgi:hypothetical protein